MTFNNDIIQNVAGIHEVNVLLMHTQIYRIQIFHTFLMPVTDACFVWLAALMMAIL